MTQQISNWAGGGASVTEGAVQLGLGLIKKRQADKMYHQYDIPPEIQQNLNQANIEALKGLPLEQKQEYLNNLQKSNAYSLSSLGDLNAGIRGVAGANEQFNQGYDKLLGADSAARMANQDKLYGLRNEMADYKDKSWQFNVKNPYDEKRLEGLALQGAGMQNMSQGFQQGNTGGNPYGSTSEQNRAKSQQPLPPQYNDAGNFYNYNPYSNKGGAVNQTPYDYGYGLDRTVTA